MIDLMEFLEARLLEDQQIAEACGGDDVVDWIADDTKEHGEVPGGEHIQRWLPSRVLAEVTAKRKLLEGHGDAAIVLVQLYVSHPDFDQGWLL